MSAQSTTMPISCHRNQRLFRQVSAQSTTISASVSLVNDYCGKCQLSQRIFIQYSIRLNYLCYPYHCYPDTLSAQSTTRRTHVFCKYIFEKTNQNYFTKFVFACSCSSHFSIISNCFKANNDLARKLANLCKMLSRSEIHSILGMKGPTIHMVYILSYPRYIYLYIYSTYIYVYTEPHCTHTEKGKEGFSISKAPDSIKLEIRRFQH